MAIIPSLVTAPSLAIIPLLAAASVGPSWAIENAYLMGALALNSYIADFAFVRVLASLRAASRKSSRDPKDL